MKTGSKGIKLDKQKTLEGLFPLALFATMTLGFSTAVMAVSSLIIATEV